MIWLNKENDSKGILPDIHHSASVDVVFFLKLSFILQEIASL